MRRASLLLTALSSFLIAIACQDERNSLPSDPGALELAGRGVCPAEALINDLFPRGLANAAIQQCRNIQRQFDRGKVEDAYEKLADLIDFTLQHLENGKLLDPPGPDTTEDGVSQLIVALNMIVGLASSGDEIPADAFTSEGGIVQTVDAEEAWDIETRDGYAGITKAAGVPVFLNGVPYDGPVTVFIAPIDPSESSFPSFGLEIGGPDRAAFPVFKDLGTIPDGLQFGDGNISETPDPTNELVVELCSVDPPHPLAPFPSQLPDLRVGHITEGEVVDTPLRDSTLDCSGVNDEVPTMALFKNRLHRWANAALGPALQLFDVAKLHAAPGRFGGAISSFSEFGGIDQTKLAGPAVDILSPADPTTTSNATVQLQGTVNDPAASATATLTGATTLEIQLELDGAGSFSQEIPLQVGTTVITVTAIDENGGSGEDSVEVTRTGTPEALTATLTWDTATDMDLHVMRGAGTAFFDSTDDCYFANCLSSNGPDWGPEGPAGNPVLDFDDTSGFGPENTRLDQVETDLVYQVGVDAFSGTAEVLVRVVFEGTSIECGPVLLESNTANNRAILAIIDPQPGGDGAYCTTPGPPVAASLSPARSLPPAHPAPVKGTSQR